MIYTDGDHKLMTDATSRHLYKTMTSHLEECFDGFDHHKKLGIVIEYSPKLNNQ